MENSRKCDFQRQQGNMRYIVPLVVKTERAMAAHPSVLAWRIPGTGAWWAAGHGVAQRRKRLKRLSSSSSSSGKKPASQCPRLKRLGFDPWIRKIPWRRVWQPTTSFLLGESHEQRSLTGCFRRVVKSRTWLKRLAQGHSRRRRRSEALKGGEVIHRKMS